MKISPENRVSGIKPTTNTLTLADRWDHVLVRLGVRRGEHRVEPGLYALGNPTPDSPVFITANYTLSFDTLRSALKGIDGYILVLDTKGINVWCAAGKGTFGTDELVHRIEATNLSEIVSHRILILPQLGAPGIAAHEVKKRAHFKVEYGPVRAQDLPEYLKTRKATPEMRKVEFTLRDRLELIPLEIAHFLLPLLAIAVALYFVVGLTSALAATSAILAGVVLFPILLPWLPTHNFSVKGFLLGGLIALPFALSVFIQHPDWAWWRKGGQALEFMLVMPAITAYLALNFTGSSTFTSRSGVRREMNAYIPTIAWTFGIGVFLAVAFAVARWLA